MYVAPIVLAVLCAAVWEVSPHNVTATLIFNISNRTQSKSPPSTPGANGTVQPTVYVSEDLEEPVPKDRRLRLSEEKPADKGEHEAPCPE